jgi:hypothetical protein
MEKFYWTTIESGYKRYGRKNVKWKKVARQAWQLPYKYDQASVESSLLDSQPSDVLFGRGATLQRHPGNLYFRSLIDAQREMYDSAGRGTKSEIASKIIQLVKESFGRFLKQEPNGVWTEVEDDVARLKASAAFRTWRSSICKVVRSINSNPTNVSWHRSLQLRRMGKEKRSEN